MTPPQQNNSDKTREFRRMLTAALTVRGRIAEAISRGVPRAALFSDIETYQKVMASARRLLLLVCAAFIAVMTTCCVNYPKPVPGQTSEIGFMVKPEINVRFQRIAGGDYNAIVQEIVFGDGGALVECSLAEHPGTTVWDRHTWSSETQVRHMKVYLAKVDGVDWDHKGFAHLPQNMDGTVKTTVGPNFNKSYQDHHETRGRVVAMSREYFTWSMRAGLQRCVVEAP